MTTITIIETSIFIISLVAFLLWRIVLILPVLKKAVINLSALALILAVLFINLVRDVERAIKYVTIG